MQNHYLYISSTGLVALRMNGSTLEPSGRFETVDPSNHGQAEILANEFSNWLRKYQLDRFHLLLDSSEEEIVLEELPPLSRRDRATLIEKRLGLRYRESRFKTWMPFALIGPKPGGLDALTGRQASSCVVAVIRGEMVLSPWIHLIESAHVCLDSLHSTALLATELVGRRMRTKNGLLLSMQPGGLRQSLIINGAVRFSRLAPIFRIADYNALAGEIESTIQYLLMSQIIQREQLTEDFSIWALSGGLPNFDDQLVQLVESGATQPITVIDDTLKSLMSAEQAADLGLASLPNWFALLSRGKVGTGYATPEQRIYSNANTFKGWMRAGAAGVASACLFASIGLETYRYFRYDPLSLLNRYQYLISEKQQELDSTHSEFGVTGSELSLIAYSAGALRARAVRADSIASMVSDAIGNETDLRVDRLAWRRTAFDTAGAMAQLTLPPPSAVLAPTSSTPAAMTVLPASGANVHADDYTGIDRAALHTQLVTDLVIDLQGKVPVRIGKSESNQRVEELRGRLKSICRCEVEILKWPFDNSPATSLQGDFAGKTSRQSVQFELRATDKRTRELSLKSRHMPFFVLIRKSAVLVLVIISIAVAILVWSYSRYTADNRAQIENVRKEQGAKRRLFSLIEELAAIELASDSFSRLRKDGVLGELNKTRLLDQVESALIPFGDAVVDYKLEGYKEFSRPALVALTRHKFGLHRLTLNFRPLHEEEFIDVWRALSASGSGINTVESCELSRKASFVDGINAAAADTGSPDSSAGGTTKPVTRLEAQCVLTAYTIRFESTNPAIAAMAPGSRPNTAPPSAPIAGVSSGSRK